MIFYDEEDKEYKAQEYDRFIEPIIDIFEAYEHGLIDAIKAMKKIDQALWPEDTDD